jgi:hypothetical protein
VQGELIQTVDNILFFPATSRREEAETLADVFGGGQSTPEGHQGVGGGQGQGGGGQVNQREEQGMFPHLGSDHLTSLVESLLAAHAFAAKFNLHNEQVKNDIFEHFLSTKIHKTGVKSFEIS